ncbi:MAG: hypothetical protein RLZZ15_4061 [Verrucomicrobiota bacterium]
MNPLVRALRATRACYRRQIYFRRDLWIFSVWLVLIGILGDDLVLWMIGLFSTAARTAVATWGGGGTTLAFGVVPAVGLTVAMFRRDWCECWRHAAREIA